MSDPILEMNRTLGILLARVENLQSDQQEDRRAASDFRREVRDEIGGLKQQVTDLDHKVTPAIETVALHAEKIKAHDKEVEAMGIFRKKIGAVIAGGTVLVTTIGGGVWWLITAYWELIVTAVKAMFSRGTP